MSRIISIIIIVHFITGLFAQHTDKMEFERLVAAECQAHSGFFQGKRFVNQNTESYDLKYHRLEFTVDPAVRFISGAITSYFIPKSNDFDNIQFDLHVNMQVDSVLFHGTSLTWSHHSGQILEIPLNDTIGVGVLDSITVYYQGNPPNTGFGSYATQKVCGGSYDAMWTLSEPYGAKDWWPCKQSLSDKIDSVDIIITTPAEFTAVTNGLLLSSLHQGSDSVFHYRHTYPIPAYLIAIAVSEYEVYSDSIAVYGGGQLFMQNHLYPCQSATATSINSSTEDIMLLFTELFGPYPYPDEKYGHTQFGWGGGMEHTTNSFMGGFSHFLIAHELAHQWFGDQITCGSWQDIWLNEGFATYLEGMNYEHGIGPNSWPNWLNGKMNHVFSSTSGSVWVNDTTSVSRIFNSRLSYSKGALLLHMLRWTVGDSVFFSALNNYLLDPDLTYGYARTIDLQNHLESESGQDLDEFFDDWFYGQGWPTYGVRWYQDQCEWVRIRLNQSQSHGSVDFFEMAIPVQFNGSSQDSTVVFNHLYSGQRFDVQLPFTVTSVVFDPEIWILGKDTVINDGSLKLDHSIIDADEENDILDSATVLFPSDTITAYIGHLTTAFDSNDYYRLVLPSAGNLDIWFYYVSSEDNSPILTLLDRSGTVSIASDSLNEREGVLLLSLDCLSTSDTFYLKVSDDYCSVYSLAWNLDALVLPEIGDYEPNDNAGTANEWNDPYGHVHGSVGFGFHVPDQYDYFLLSNLTAGDSLFFDIEIDEGAANIEFRNVDSTTALLSLPNVSGSLQKDVIVDSDGDYSLKLESLDCCIYEIGVSGCVSKLVYLNTSINGYRQARDSIIINNVVVDSAAVFSAPVIRVDSLFQVDTLKQFEAVQEGCGH